MATHFGKQLRNSGRPPGANRDPSVPVTQVPGPDLRPGPFPERSSLSRSQSLKLGCVARPVSLLRAGGSPGSLPGRQGSITRITGGRCRWPLLILTQPRPHAEQRALTSGLPRAAVPLQRAVLKVAPRAQLCCDLQPAESSCPTKPNRLGHTDFQKDLWERPPWHNIPVLEYKGRPKSPKEESD